MNFQLNGYHFIRANNPSNTERWSVCNYHEENEEVFVSIAKNL